MKLAAAVIVATLALPSVSLADKWTGADTGLEIAYGALLAVDYMQTLDIAKDGKEGNRLMGEHGGGVSPSLYFATQAVVHVAVVAVLPQPYRRIAQGVTIGVEIDVLHSNWQAGYSLSF